MNCNIKKKVLIAMSGGVDSSVAAYLMKQQGYDCAGATMKLFDDDEVAAERGRTCCSLEDVEDARSVAHRLDIPYYVYNFTDEFETQVIDRFIRTYQNGATPNPCIDCNRYMKFEKLFLRAMLLGIDYVATGHYARIETDEVTGQYLLKKAIDETKDQSYVLYFMTQEQLAHTLLPLGGLHKSQIREVAAEQGFINAQKRDSQDICFVRDGDYAGFIERHSNKTFGGGDFIDTQGNVLGKHKGLIRYTIGQRKGLGISFDRPMYVQSKNTAANTITLCRGDELYTTVLEADNFNWITFEKNPDKSIRVKAKVRYNQQEQWAEALQISDSTVRIEFDEPQRAIAKGQAVVLYDGDIVIGGGTIK